MDLKRKVYIDLLNWKNQKDHHTLEVSGARQVGKTYIVEKFAYENYQQVIIVNLMRADGQVFLECYQQEREQSYQYQRDSKIFVEHWINRYYDGFINDRNTILVIDEIQESSAIYNQVRSITRYLNCDVIITGSYLGKIASDEYFVPVGDLDFLEVTPLDFEEFADAAGYTEWYTSLDLVG